MPSALVELRRDSKEHRQSVAVAPKRAPAPAKEFQRKEMRSFDVIAGDAIDSREPNSFFCTYAVLDVGRQ